MDNSPKEERRFWIDIFKMLKEEKEKREESEESGDRSCDGRIFKIQ